MLHREGHCYPEHHVNFLAAWTLHLNPVPFPCYSSPSPLISKAICMLKDTVPMYSKCSHGGNQSKASSLLCSNDNKAHWGGSGFIECPVEA